MVIRYLYDQNNYVWKIFFRYYWNCVMGCGDFTLPMMAMLPEYYRKVLLAHAEFLNHTDFECCNVNEVREMPIFMNKKVKWKDQVLYNESFLEAGFRQFKDVMYEVVPGFVPQMALFDAIHVIDDRMARKTI